MKKEKEWRGSVRIPMSVYVKIKKLAYVESRSFTRQLEVTLKDGLSIHRASLESQQ